MSNARIERSASVILRTLVNKGTMTGPALISWLGNPYYFTDALSALVKDGRVTAAIQHTNFGIIRRYSAAATKVTR